MSKNLEEYVKATTHHGASCFNSHISENAIKLRSFPEETIKEQIKEVFIRK